MTKQKHFYLFRGLIREKKHWGDFPEKLLGAFPEAKVSMLDLPGAGEYYRERAPTDIAKMVEQMRREFLTLSRDPQEDSILVAFSLGGMVAAQWLKAFPQDFHRAVLINTSYRGMSSFTHRLLLNAWPSILKVPFLKGREREAHVLRLVTNHSEGFDEALEIWDQIQRERPISMGNTLRQLIAAAKFSIGSFRPQVPVHVFASTRDRMVSVECSRAIARIWRCTIDEHPTAGHDIVIDDPSWVLATLRSRLP